MNKKAKEDSLVVRLLNRELKLFNRKVLERYNKLEAYPVPKFQPLKFIRGKNFAYYGGVDDEENYNGLGAIVENNGTIFEGYYLNGMKAGLGRLVKSNGETYTGTWGHNGITDGKFMVDSVTYQGKFLNEMPEGQGRETYPDGTVFEGSFNKGTKTGDGAYTFPDGSKLSAKWDNNVIVGDIVYTFANGETYTGPFVNGSFEGKGVFIWPDGFRYQGHFKNGKRHGKGETMGNDNPHIRCHWVQDMPHGKVAIQEPDGSEKTVMYSNGEIIDKGLDDDGFEFPKTSSPTVPPPHYNYKSAEKIFNAAPGDKLRIAETFLKPSLPLIGEFLRPDIVQEEEVKVVKPPPADMMHATQMALRNSTMDAYLLRENLRDELIPRSRMNSTGKAASESVSRQHDSQMNPIRHEDGTEASAIDEEESVALSDSDDEDEEHSEQALVLKKNGKFPDGALKYREETADPNAYTKKTFLKRLKPVIRNFEVRTDLSEEVILTSLNYLNKVIREVPEPILAAQVIEIRRNKLGPFEYDRGLKVGGFTEWIKLSDDSFYKGEWSIAKMRWGRGVHIDGGELYEGMWHKDMKYGMGRHVNIYGDFYIGYWMFDIKSGFGILRREDGYEYIGDWENDVPHGSGTEATPKGIYQGNFNYGIKQGKGQIKFADNLTSFKGEFVKGKIEGFGVLSQAGKSYAGIWSDNKLVGRQVRVNSSMHLDSKADQYSHLILDEYFEQALPKFTRLETEQDVDLIDDYAEEVVCRTLGWIDKDLLEEMVLKYSADVEDEIGQKRKLKRNQKELERRKRQERNKA